MFPSAGIAVCRTTVKTDFASRTRLVVLPIAPSPPMAFPPRRFLHWLRRLARNMYFWGGLAVLLVFALLAYGLVDAVIMPSYTRHGVAVQMPDVQNQPFTQARQVLEAKNLRVNRQSGRYNPNVPQDIVVDQNPPPTASVKPGRRVYLTVNAGEARKVTLPDLSGTSLREARNRLTTLGLTVDTVQADSIPSPYPNTVTRQSPQPGDSLKEGEGVALWYSRGLGNERVRVPNLRGLPMQSAQRYLLHRKLRWVVVDTSSVGVRPDSQRTPAVSDTMKQALFVRNQGRSPGERVRAGTEVRLYPTSDSLLARSLLRAQPDSIRPDSVLLDSLRRDSTRIGF